MTQPLHDPRVATLRHDFDAAFARPPAERAEESEDLLAVRIAGDAFAVRLRDIDGVVANRRVVPFPGGHSDCLGVAGIRGLTVPVFDLAALLGYGAGGEAPQWMVLSGRDDAIALAFDDFDGYLRLPRSSFRVEEKLRSTRPHVTEVASTAAGVLAVIGLPPLVAMIRNRAGRARLVKEH